MTYAQKLRDPRWQRCRLQVLKAANFTCQECGATKETLVVHHRRYERGKEPWEAAPADLVCLCECCHTERHALLEEIKQIAADLPRDLLSKLNQRAYELIDVKIGTICRSEPKKAQTA
jgi:hypothetical protein